MVKLYQLFIENDATLVEINPMAEINNGKGAAVLHGWGAPRLRDRGKRLT